jgi:hypothetical protein
LRYYSDLQVVHEVVLEQDMHLSLIKGQFSKHSFFYELYKYG